MLGEKKKNKTLFFFVGVVAHQKQFCTCLCKCDNELKTAVDDEKKIGVKKRICTQFVLRVFLFFFSFFFSLSAVASLFFSAS